MPSRTLQPEIVIEDTTSEKDIFINGELYEPPQSPPKPRKSKNHSKSRSRTKDEDADEPSPESEALSHIKKKLDSTLNQEFEDE